MARQRKETDPVTDAQMQEDTLLPVREERPALVDAAGLANTTAVLERPAVVTQCKNCGTFRQGALTKTLEHYGPYTNVPVCERCYEKLTRQATLVVE